MPARTANKGPNSGQDHLHKPQERAKTANIGPQRAAQDRQHKPQERPKTANISPKSAPARKVGMFFAFFRPRPPT